MREREFNYDITYRTLSNNVRHIDISIPYAKTTACVGFVKTGARNETPGKDDGLHHFKEHLDFMGSRNYPTYELWTKAVDHQGTEHDATTEKEYVEYYLFSPSENREKSLVLLSELFHPIYPAREMKRGKDYVVKEVNLSFDNPDEVVRDLFEQFLFDGSRMANSIYGDVSRLEIFSRRDLRKLGEKWFRGGNILVVTAGRTNRMRSLVADNFGALASGPIMPYEGTVDYGKPGLKVFTSTKTEDVYFALGVPGVALNDERYYSLMVAATIIGGNESIGTSRLYQAVQIKGAHTYNLVSRVRGGSDSGFFVTQGSVGQSQLENVLAKIRKEVFSLAFSATKEEVRRAKIFLKGQLKRDLENTLTVAERVGIPALMFDKIEHPSDMLGSIEAVRLDDVRRVAEEILNPDEERLVVLGPVNEKLRKVRNLNFIK